jgi:hypothetical protein
VAGTVLCKDKGLRQSMTGPRGSQALEERGHAMSRTLKTFTVVLGTAALALFVEPAQAERSGSSSIRSGSSYRGGSGGSAGGSSVRGDRGGRADRGSSNRGGTVHDRSARDPRTDMRVRRYHRGGRHHDGYRHYRNPYPYYYGSHYRPYWAYNWWYYPRWYGARYYWSSWYWPWPYYYGWLSYYPRVAYYGAPYGSDYGSRDERDGGWRGWGAEGETRRDAPPVRSRSYREHGEDRSSWRDTAWLFLEIDEPDAEVFLNGSLVGRADEFGRLSGGLSVRAGTHTLEVRSRRAGQFEAAVRVAPGEQKLVRHRFADRGRPAPLPAPSSTGSLDFPAGSTSVQLRASPGASIYVNDRFVGAAGADGVLVLTLSQGQHSLAATRPGASTVARTVTIRTGTREVDLMR